MFGSDRQQEQSIENGPVAKICGNGPQIGGFSLREWPSDSALTMRISDTKSANERVNRFASWLQLPAYKAGAAAANELRAPLERRERQRPVPLHRWVPCFWKLERDL
jgi:hypothetical protein